MKLQKMYVGYEHGNYSIFLILTGSLLSSCAYQTTCYLWLWTGVDRGIYVLQILKVPLGQVFKGIALTAHAVIAEVRGHIPAALL